MNVNPSWRSLGLTGTSCPSPGTSSANSLASFSSASPTQAEIEFPVTYLVTGIAHLVASLLGPNPYWGCAESVQSLFPMRALPISEIWGRVLLMTRILPHHSPKLIFQAKYPQFLHQLKPFTTNLNPCNTQSWEWILCSGPEYHCSRSYVCTSVYIAQGSTGSRTLTWDSRILKQYMRQNLAW